MVFILGELFHKSRVGAQDAIASHILLPTWKLHLCAQALLQRYLLFSKRIGFGDFEVWGLGNMRIFFYIYETTVFNRFIAVFVTLFCTARLQNTHAHICV